MSKKVSLALSIFLLIPLLMTGYSLQAETYPCISSIECYINLKKESKTCDCPNVTVKTGRWTKKTHDWTLTKIDPSGGCVLTNIKTSEKNYPFIPICSNK
ncbi:MAG: hypothetical protein KBD90_02405 [Alphaproteobacteria bacterium]|nr:hypothetical protein [Alphaproteobacteria bacterium]